MGSTARRPRSLAVLLTALVLAAATTTVAAARPLDGDGTSAAAPGGIRPPTATAKFDRYGGDLSVRLHATGRFRTQRVGGRWWLVTPEGHPYWFAGIANADPTGTADRNGHYAYADTVAQKYGSVANWADAQLVRFRDWGINGLGGWGDVSSLEGRVPYTRVLGLGGWRTDYWSPSWATGARRSIAATAAEVRNDPWFIGYFTDNEMSWALDIRTFQTSFDIYLAMPASAPGKQELLRFLRERYHGSIDAVRADFPALTATTWEQLAQPVEPIRFTEEPGGQATQGEWSGRIMAQYFSVVGPALRQADPRHLNLGVRFIAQLTSPQVLREASRWVDVLSVNYYEPNEQWGGLQDYAAARYPLVPTAGMLREFSGGGAKPLLISEYGYRAADSGLPNTWPPAMPVLATQAERGAAVADYGTCALGNPSMVGTVFFEMTDEPAAGRFDGEDSNWGLVGEDDEPYPEVTRELRTLHDAAYARLRGYQPPACRDFEADRPAA